MKKYALSLPLALGLMFGCADGKVGTVTGNAPSPQDSEVSATAAAASHGMVIFGTDTLFVSHIPMFMTPHDWQALMQVSLSHAQSDALAVYQKALTPGKQGLFTIRPKPFVLPNLLAGKIKSFQADLYRGNFEAGGKVILSNITVTVDNVLYSTQLSKSTQAADQLTYIPVEANGASFLVHQITAPKNFDHIVQIQWLDESAIANNALRSFKALDTESARLKTGQYFSVSDDGVTLQSSSANGAAFRVVSDFYCTKGPDFYNVCN